jgi:hypothetical protein
MWRHVVRNKGGNPTPNERAKVRVVMVEFEGASGDLQQLAQTLANAVRPQQIVMPIQAPSAQAALPAPPAINGAAIGQPRDLFTEYSDAEEVLESDASLPEARPSTPKVTSSVRRKPKTPELIEDIDFTSDPKPFKQFLQELGVEDHGRRYLGIAQWFKEHRQIAEIGADHIYTCYKFLAIAVPEDVTAAFRAMKKKGAVAQGSSRGMYRITHVGENMLTEARKQD